MTTRDPRFKLTTEDILIFASEGINFTIGVNSGNPDWSREDWEFHYRAQKEIVRRLKLVRSAQIKSDKTEV
jgi:hypothetical protein